MYALRINLGIQLGNKTCISTKMLKTKQNVNVVKYNATAKRGNLNSERIGCRFYCFIALLNSQRLSGYFISSGTSCIFLVQEI